MTKNADTRNEDLASAFIVSTCQLLPKSSSVLSDCMHNLMGSDKLATKTYAIVCGSSVELYIRPLNICIEDSDILMAESNELAFSGDFPVLPSDLSGLSDTVECYKIERYHEYPGFVRLRDFGKMTYNWQNKNYEFVNTWCENVYMRVNVDACFVSEVSPLTRTTTIMPHIASGPAVKHGKGFGLGSDIVLSVWCPEWPKEARGWRKRPRNNGWPTIDTIAEVKKNGCNVLKVNHPSCRNAERLLQWRLSFSLAEIILLQSWTPIQQIVYHLLRFFAKRELIQNDCPKEDEVLCTYHFKTLMLYACEEMTPEWWNSSSVFSICCELLKKLSEWLMKKYCPNYFIPEANLFHEPSNREVLVNTERRLNEFRNSRIICNWFMENYIMPFVWRHFGHESAMEKLPHFMDCMLPLIEFWKASERKSLDALLFYTFASAHNNSRFGIIHNLSSGLRHHMQVGYHLRCIALITNRISTVMDLPTIQNVSCFTYYDNLLYSLHIAYGLSCGDILWDSSLIVEFFTSIVSQPNIIRSRYHNYPKARRLQTDHFKFLRPQTLMKNLTGLNSCPEFQLLSLIAKESLKKASDCVKSEFHGIAHASSAYLAALYFVTSEYQQSMRFCLSILLDRTSQENKETLNAGCLLFIDDVARVAGLCVLNMKITDNVQHIGRPPYLDL